MDSNFLRAEKEFLEPPDDKEYNYCQCCERVECKIFNGEHICEDCQYESGDLNEETN